MRFVQFCHSFVSCWNHGNAHFIRGIARELIRRGHEYISYEPSGGWSRTNLIRDHGQAALDQAAAVVPGVSTRTYDLQLLDLDQALEAADVVLVHEWTDPELVARIGERRIRGGRFLLFFHDTHHRALTAPNEIERFELDGYDAVLAFGEVLREVYLARGWGRRVFTWHEAADASSFRPVTEVDKDTDLIWIGNWGDGERDHELRRFLVEPANRLGLQTRIHGVRYPAATQAYLEAHGLQYAGWLANHRVPSAFARAQVTVHIPRRPYVEALSGIPTIRMFEALACGIPLVSAPWRDVECLFPRGAYVTAANADEMTSALALLLRDHDLAHDLARTGHDAIHARHTCSHRVDELFEIISRFDNRVVRRPFATARPAAKMVLQ
jgi:spore maturation protein CgeB